MKDVFSICCYMATWEMVMKKSVKKEILGYLKIIAAGVVIGICGVAVLAGMGVLLKKYMAKKK